MQKCISKKECDCIYLTRETADEFIDALGVDKTKITINDTGIAHVYQSYPLNKTEIDIYSFGTWQVQDLNGVYEQYSEKEFAKRFELV